jgi:putrescine aminotransferase
MLWAVELLADREKRARLDTNLGVGNFIRDWCWKNGMILRNNGDILVLAPALVMSKEEIDWMLDSIGRAIEAAMREFGFASQ